MSTTEDRAGAIQAILGDVARRCESGDRVDVESVCRDHPDLMPELRSQLCLMNQVDQAYRQFRLREEIDGEDDGANGLENEQLQFLAKALPSYDILHRLDHGGQGAVYKALDRTTKREVALKIPHGGLFTSRRQQLRFAREAELLARVSHPNIVTIYECATVAGRQYLVMEYIDGIPIHDYALLEGLDLSQRIRLFMKACAGVSAAHQFGILHRDLKPSNILVDDRGEPHVLDFGLAKSLGDSEHDAEETLVSIEGQVVGTLQYLSPEQASGSQAIDLRSDIYSLGIMLYELITGALPYRVVQDRQSLQRAIIEDDPKTLRTGLARTGDSIIDSGAIDEDLETIIHKALDKEPGRRYQSVAAFSDDLGRYLAGDAVEARAASGFYVLRKTLRRFRVHLAVVAGFVLLLIAGLLSSLVLWQRAENIAKIAQSGLELGSFVRQATVHRDEGHAQEAIAMLEKAVEIAAFVPPTHPFVRRQLFTAHYVLADLYIRNGDRMLAVQHADALASLAEELGTREPHDTEINRMFAFAQRTRGEQRGLEGDWAAALARFQDADAGFRQVHDEQPEDARAIFDLADLLGRKGTVFQKLGQDDEFLQTTDEARALLADLCTLDPQNPKYVLELSRIEARLATWHLLRRRPEDNLLAAEISKASADRLEFILQSQPNTTFRVEIRGLLELIQENRRLAERRLAPPP